VQMVGGVGAISLLRRVSVEKRLVGALRECPRHPRPGGGAGEWGPPASPGFRPLPALPSEGIPAGPVSSSPIDDGPFREGFSGPLPAGSFLQRRRVPRHLPEPGDVPRPLWIA